MEPQIQQLVSDDHHPQRQYNLMAAGSQPESLQNGHKRQRVERPRPPLSCLECKRKKIKCDRLLPCHQCKKLAENNKPAHCVYASPPASVSSVLDDSCAEDQPLRSPPSISSDTLRTQLLLPLPAFARGSEDVADLQHRVASIERLLAIPSAASTPAPSHVGTRDPLPNQAGMLFFKKGQFRYGPPGFKLTLLIENFPEIRIWMNNSRDDADLKFMKKDFRSYQKIFTRGHRCVLVQLSIASANLNDDMLRHLNEIPILETLVDIYFKHFEHIHRILHGPTFYRNFERFRACPKELRASEFDAFIPQLALAALLGASLDQQSPFYNEIAGAVPAPQCVIDTMEAWLERTPKKARRELDYLRSQCLLLLAMHVNQAPAQQQWNFSGSLVRSAMLMGLHQDPSQFPSLSIFQAEMRRKLWFTIVELDLQISIRLGMPSMVRTTSYNTRPPANLDDFELQEDMESLTPHPAHQFTKASCQVALAQSLPMRLEALELNQSVTANPEYNQVLRLGRRIERFLQELPACLKCETQAQPDEDIGRTFILIMLNTHIRSALACLYVPYTVYSLRQHPVLPEPLIYEEATRAYVASAAHILSSLDFFRSPPLAVPSSISTPTAAVEAGAPSISNLKHGLYTLYHRLFNASITRAALIIGMQIRATCAPTLSSPPTTPTPAGAMQPPSPSHLLSLLDSTLTHSLSILSSPDGDLREALMLALVRAHVSIPPTTPDHDHDARLRDAADMVLTACRKQLGPLSDYSSASPIEQQLDAAVGPHAHKLGSGPDGLANSDMAVYGDGGGGSEFMGAEGVDFTSGLDMDWGLSWI